MGFRLVDDVADGAHKMWVEVSETEVVYKGQLVQWNTDTYGVEALTAANGAADVTDDSIVAGLVVATSNKIDNKVFEDGTTIPGFAGEKITGVVSATNLAARENFGVTGMNVKDRKSALVQIVPILTSTRLRGQIYNAAYGTAPTLLTVSTASADGGVADSYITNAADATSVANYSTFYFRTGVNTNLYRTLASASTTTHLNDKSFNNAVISVGDKGVMVNGRQGFARLQFDAASLYINAGASLAAYYTVFIDTINLKTAGEEFMEFRFTSNHLGDVTA